MRFLRVPVLAPLCLLVAVTATGLAQRSAPAAKAPGAAEATARIVKAAQAVAASLDDAGRAKLQFAFDSAQKTNWSNLPTGIYERHGLRMGDLTPPQKAAVMTLLETALSPDGYRKVIEIVRGDETLRKGVGRLTFGEAEYYLAFVGTPSTTTPWMLQFGGHHLAINLTLAGSAASMAPSLPAAQPAKYTFEGKEIRPLGRENDKAFELINALDAAGYQYEIKTVGGYRAAFWTWGGYASLAFIGFLWGLGLDERLHRMEHPRNTDRGRRGSAPSGGARSRR
jgi:hypothetical protein